MKRVAMSLVLLTMVASVVGLELSAPSAQTAPQKVVFALNWFPVGDHAAYWVALGIVDPAQIESINPIAA